LLILTAEADTSTYGEYCILQCRKPPKVVFTLARKIIHKCDLWVDAGVEPLVKSEGMQPSTVLRRKTEVYSWPFAEWIVEGIR
jgi:hypothetical protein